MFQRLALVLFTIFMFSFGLIVQAAPLSNNKSQALGSTFDSSTNILQKREAGLVQALSWGLLAVNDGVKSTIDGIQNPKVPGTKEGIERSATDAGQNVGSAIATPCLPILKRKIVIQIDKSFGDFGGKGIVHRALTRSPGFAAVDNINFFAFKRR